MAEFELFRGTPHPLSFRGERRKVDNMGPLTRPPRAESNGERSPVTQLMVESGGIRVPVPVYEVSFGKIDAASARTLGSLAANQLVVMSRLAERGAALRGVSHGFAHPAYMERDSSRRIARARYAAIPQEKGAAGNPSRIAAARNLSEVTRLINCMPEEMWLKVGGREMHLDRGNQDWIDVHYRYEILGRSAENVAVAASSVQSVDPVPKSIPDNTLLLAHTEAILEAARGGVDPDIVAKMVFAVGMERNASGYQGNVLRGVGYYSKRTLKTFLDDVRI